MMNKAKCAGCFQYGRGPINSFDILTEYLYNNNPMHPFRARKPLAQIPFVESHLEDFPRLSPPKVLSMSWTVDERAVLIQRWWRGYLVRRNPEVRDLKKWQREWRSMNREETISDEVSRFWERVMPSGNSSTATTPTGSRSEASSSTQLSPFAERPRAQSIAHNTRYTATRTSPSRKSYSGATQLQAEIHMGDRQVDDDGRLVGIQEEC
ncbi:IQ domain-containing protein K-like [Littorina saxatilis]|uniref:IQ domain-containing protein K-like n=1 Tax=Littorina saxatilis TaxID=31220 RepID=UPI0038B5BEF6